MNIRINDGRKLNREAQAQIRITAVQRVLAGESPEEVVKSIGYNRRIIYHWLAFTAQADSKRCGSINQMDGLLNSQALK
jgi:DNA invertase Pin-like site-specific DNA recombinase